MYINKMTDVSLQEILYINDEIKNFFNEVLPESIGSGNHLGKILIVCNDWQVIEMIEELIMRKCIKDTIKRASLLAIEQPRDMVALLTALDENDILLMDGESFGNDKIYYMFKNAIENYNIEMEIGKGTAAHVFSFDIPKASHVLLITELSKQILDMTHLFDHVLQVDNIDLVKMKTLLTFSDKKLVIGDDIYNYILEAADDNIETAFRYMIGFSNYCRNNNINLVNHSNLEEYLKISNIRHPSEMSADEIIINLLRDIKNHYLLYILKFKV